MAEPTPISPEALELLTLLHRGGRVGYLWTKTVPATPTLFFKVGEIPLIPPTWKNVYFCVLPLASRRSNFQRGRIADVQSAGCVFAEFDAKDYFDDKPACLAYVRSLAIPPTWLIDSGGGYHAYWILGIPLKIETEEQRAYLVKLQARWVDFVGGDPGAKDLARVLRVPGTMNHKYDPPRPVVVVKRDGPLYTLAELESAIPPEEIPQEEKKTYQAPTGDRTDPGGFWLSKYLSEATIGNGDGKGFSLACELRDSGLSDSEIFGALCQYADQVDQDRSHPFTSNDARRWLDSALTRSPREAATLPRAAHATKRNETPPEPEAQPIEGTTEYNEPEERPRFIVRHIADALQPRPPVEYIIDQLVIPKSVSVFYGEGGAKKTYSLLAMAAQVASGGAWLGYKTKQTPVLFIDQEMGEDGLERRITEVWRGEELGLDFDIAHVCYAGFKMDNKYDPAILKALIEETGAGLVIIDALAEIMDGDENSKADVQPVFNNLRWIADQTGAAIIVIHHSNKAGGYRGSTVIKNSVDLLVMVDSEDGQNIVNFTTEKNRYGGGQLKWAAVATWIKDPEGAGGDTFTLRPWSQVKTEHLSKSQKYVIRFLEDKNAPATMDEIMGAADSCSEGAARQAVFALVDKRKVIRTDAGGRGTAGLFALVKEAEYDPQF